MLKAKINTECNADRYAAANERIIELSDGTDQLGCLLSIRLERGRLVIGVYSADEGIEVQAGDNVVVSSDRFEPTAHTMPTV